MKLLDLLIEMGYKGVELGYNDTFELVVFFFNIDKHNPAVTKNGTIVSVGTMPIKVHGRVLDGRAYNPLHNRQDFDLASPDSLRGIEDYLIKMMDKCEPKFKQR